MKMPWVASAACWRKTVEFAFEVSLCPDDVCKGRGSWRMSIGMESLWHAKMAFMIGMYWCARSVEGEAEMSRIRDWRVWLAPSPVVVEASAVPVFPDVPINASEMRIDSRLM